MERRVVLQTSDQCIYLIKDTNLDFYMVIPNSRRVSIVLGIFPDVGDNDIKSLPKESDKVIVVPVINGQILTNANHLDTVSFKYLDNVLSYLINASYKVLTHNRLEVDKRILLNNHSMYSNFNNKYIEKYQGRVELYNLIQKSNPEITNVSTEVFEPVSATTVIPTFKPVEPMFKNSDSSNSVLDELEASVYSDVSIEREVPVVSGDNKEPGFVSYILLGVLSAVVLLVLLYMVL